MWDPALRGAPRTDFSSPKEKNVSLRVCFKLNSLLVNFGLICRIADALIDSSLFVYFFFWLIVL